MGHLKHLVFGILFGIILVKAEVISWFRIQEMFRFHSFHMYGIIGSAAFLGMLSILLIKKFKLKSFNYEDINLTPKTFNMGFIYGGIIFGIGWAMTGACPGPLYALVGSGFSVLFVSLFFAVVGAYVYGLLKKTLPH